MATGDKIILKDGKGLLDVSGNPNYKHQVVVDENVEGVPDVQFYNGLLQGKRRRTRILFAVRIKFNMGEPDEYVTPILTKFNLIGALYNGVDEYEQQGIIKITPSHI